jgi:hypothetical protein
MRMIRTIKNWVQCFEATPAPHSAEEAIARRILGDLTGYRDNSQHKDSDVKQLANAIQAYAYLLQKHGVTVVVEECQ